MNPFSAGLIIFLLVVLAYLLVVMCVEIAKVLAKNRSQKFKKLNAAEITLIIIFIFLWIWITASLPKEYSFISIMLGFGFWLVVSQRMQQNQEPKRLKNKYPTLEDIQRKYPKRKAVEIPTDGIYEDFSRELTPLEEVEGESIEVEEPSFNRLLELSHGNRDIAIGFILRNMVEGKSAQWACERAIEKIESHIPRR